MHPGDWEGTSQCVGLMLDGRAAPSGIRKRGADATMLLVYNAWHDMVEFTLPVQGGDPQHWTLLLDTNLDVAPPPSDKTAFGSGDVYAVTGRSFLLFGIIPKS